MHRRHIDALEIVKPGARTLEVGCGNGSICAWLAKRVSPGGKAVAFDLDLSLVEAQVPNLELRQGDIVAGPVGARRIRSGKRARCASPHCERGSGNQELGCKRSTRRRA